MRNGMLLRAALAVLACIGLSGCVYYLNPVCTDLIRNGDETGIDCGGACSPCPVGERCNATSDCDQSTCEDGRCTPLPCGNGVQDGAETDVDCGGDTCRKCPGGRRCEVGADCFNGNCEAATKTCFALDNVTFAPAVSYAAGSKPYVLFGGDLDNDGDVDLAAANEQDSNIIVYLNNGTGVFAPQASYATGVYPTGGALADLNRDGVLDVVSADYRGDSVSVLLGTGGGVFAPKTTYPTVGGAETSNLAVGDLDGDGNLDVVATNPQSSSLSQLMGRADGTLADAVDVPVGLTDTSVPYSIAIGDFDRNGTADLAIADVSSLTIIVRLGNGDGTFQPEIPYLEGGLPPYILITRDVDLDGNLDLVCANRSSDDVSVLLGRGDGTFRRFLVSSTGAGTGPYAVSVADFNLDGVPDLVTPNFMSGTGSVLLGRGDGRFDPPIDAGPTGAFSYGVTAGDLDGDGRPDFATANASSNDVTVKRNTSN